jgi:RNA polymerase sigma factor (TIGR02999 family)
MSSNNSQPGDITQLLNAWGGGEAAAFDKLLPLVYQELRRIAQSQLRNERDGHTLQRTALVHEAFLRLVNQREAIGNRKLFYSFATKVMRRVLIDHARARLAEKRGGGAVVESLDATWIPESTEAPEETEGALLPSATEDDHVTTIAIDRALTSLEAQDPQQAKIVELRYFVGLSIEETAEVLGISTATVKRDWAVAKLWLKRELKTIQEDEIL